MQKTGKELGTLSAFDCSTTPDQQGPDPKLWQIMKSIQKTSTEQQTGIN